MPGARLEQQFLCLADLVCIPEKGPSVIVEILNIALLMMQDLSSCANLNDIITVSIELTTLSSLSLPLLWY